MCIVLQADVTKPGLATSESAEHIFGMCRTIVREFTTMEFTQIMEKVTRRLSLILSGGFKPSRDPQKGYGATFAEYVALCRDKNDVGSDGATVVIDPSGKHIAEQMWDSVKSVTTYAKNLVQPLLQTLGVPESEKSPFCRAFGSLEELRDEYVKYQAKTFVFRGKCGVGETGKNEDTGSVVQDSPPESIVLERVKRFANEMLGRDEESNEENSDTDSERQEELPENVPDPAPTDHEELTRNVKGVAISSTAELLQHVLRTSMCLERADKGCIKGDVSDVRKAKSLV